MGLYIALCILLTIVYRAETDGNVNVQVAYYASKWYRNFIWVNTSKTFPSSGWEFSIEFKAYTQDAVVQAKAKDPTASFKCFFICQKTSPTWRHLLYSSMAQATGDGCEANLLSNYEYQPFCFKEASSKSTERIIVGYFQDPSDAQADFTFIMSTASKTMPSSYVVGDAFQTPPPLVPKSDDDVANDPTKNKWTFWYQFEAEVVKSVICFGGYELKAGSCEQCQQGFFRTIEARDDNLICDRCPLHSQNPIRGAVWSSACICNGGFRSSSEPDGSVALDPGYTTDKYCAACQPGKAGLAGFESCMNCSVGYFTSSNASLACTPVDPGHYQDMPGQSQQIKCRKGYTNSLSGSPTCKMCSSGRYASREGQSSCNGTDPGYFQDAVGQTAQISCSAGFHNPLRAMVECLECDRGRYASASGQSVCRRTDPGYYQNETGATDQLPCKLGFFSSQPGNEECMACGVGSYTNRSMQTVCLNCRQGSYQSQHGQSMCITCGPGKTTAQIFSSSKDDCTCREGTYQEVSGIHCIPCPEGMYCAFGSKGSHFADSLAVVPLLREGYMSKVSDPFTVYKCKSSQHCPGGRPGECEDLRDSNAVACGLCVADSYEASDTKCYLCKGTAPGLYFVLASAFSITGLVMLVMMVNKDALKESNAAITTVCISGLVWGSVQCVGVFYNMPIDWPEPLRSIYSVCALFGLDMRVLKADCLIGKSPTRRYVSRQLVLPIFCLCTAIIIAVRTRSHGRSKFVLELCNSWGTLFSMFFISLCLTCLTPFICYSHPSGNGSSMADLPSILCYEDERHIMFILVSAFCLTFEVFPFIGLVVWASYNYNAFTTDARRAHILFMFRFLFKRFSPETFYYGAVYLSRSLSICLVPVAVTNKAMQCLVMCGLVQAFMVNQLHLKPWRSSMANVFDGALSGTLILAFLCGVLTTDFEADTKLVGYMGSAVFSLAFLASIFTIVYFIYLRLRPSPVFSYFICHHKNAAAGQARYMQQLLIQKTKLDVFIDVDHLTNLDGLFDIVRCCTKQLIVYLTKDTLRRPWCAGEIAIATKINLKIITLQLSSFERPACEMLLQPRNYIEQTVNLLQYNITDQDVSLGFFRVLDQVPKFSSRPNDVGMAKFEVLACAIVGAKLPTEEPPIFPALSRQMNTCSICADPEDDESIAASGILHLRMVQHVMGLLSLDMFLLCNHPSASVDMVRDVLQSSQVIIFLLGRNSLLSKTQIQFMTTAMRQVRANGLVDVIPVHLPHFKFPDKDYFELALPRLWTGGSWPLGIADERVEVDEVAEHLTSLFKRISIHLDVAVSIRSIEAQVDNIIARVPQRVDMDRQSSDGERTSKGSNAWSKTETAENKKSFIKKSISLISGRNSSPLASAKTGGAVSLIVTVEDSIQLGKSTIEKKSHKSNIGTTSLEEKEGLPDDDPECNRAGSTVMEAGCEDRCSGYNLEASTSTGSLTYDLSLSWRDVPHAKNETVVKNGRVLLRL